MKSSFLNLVKVFFLRIGVDVGHQLQPPKVVVALLPFKVKNMSSYLAVQDYHCLVRELLDSQVLHPCLGFGKVEKSFKLVNFILHAAWLAIHAQEAHQRSPKVRDLS